MALPPVLPPRASNERVTSPSRRRTRSLAAVTAVGLLGAGLFGCAAQKQLTAGESVQSGFGALGDSSALTVTVHFDQTDGSLVKALTKGSGSDKATPEQADAVAKGAIVFTIVAPDGKKLSDLKNEKTDSTGTGFGGAWDMAVNVPGGSLLDVRAVDKALYAHIGLKQISKLSGQDLSGELAGAASQVPAAYADVVKAIQNDGWISMPVSTLKKLQDTIAASSAAKNQPSMSPSTMAKLQQDVLNVLRQDTTITADSAKGDGHYKATVQLQKLVNDIMPVLKQALAGNPAAAMLDKDTSSLKDIPKTGTAELTVTDGTLSQIRFDAAQFASPSDLADSGLKHLWMAMDFSTKGSVAKPADAVQFDPTALLALAQMGGAFGGGSMSGSADSSSGTGDNGGLLSDQDLQNLMNEASGGSQG